jgi:hypothetical protein
MPTLQSKQPLILADYICNEDTANAGLSANACLPIRVLSCHSIQNALRRKVPDFEDPSDCILQLQSPASLYTGSVFPFPIVSTPRATTLLLLIDRKLQHGLFLMANQATLSSTLVGPLGYKDASGAWTKSVQLALGINRERHEAFQVRLESGLALHEK